MCFCDFDSPSVYREHVRVARKDHRCDECRKPIAKGDLYTNIFGVWDGNADTWRHCDTCSTVAKLASALHDDGPFCFVLGELHVALRECFPDLFPREYEEAEAA